MEYKNGVYKILYIFKDTLYVPIGCLTSNSFSENSEMLETTTRENAGGWKTSIPTNQSYSISFSALAPKDDNGGTILTYNDMVLLKRNKTLINWCTDSEIEGYSNIGRGYIKSISDSAEIDSFISYNGEIEGYSAPMLNIGNSNVLNITLNASI